MCAVHFTTLWLQSVAELALRLFLLQRPLFVTLVYFTILNIKFHHWQNVCELNYVEETTVYIEKYYITN